MTKVSEIIYFKKILLMSKENSLSTFQISLAKVNIHINYNNIYFDNKFDYDSIL